MAGLDFGLFPGQDKQVQTADYRTAGSHQAENLSFLSTTTADTYETVHTVTTGKTYYVSALIISTAAAGTAPVTLATGPGASEVDFFKIELVADGNFKMELPTPIKFTSGTRISFKHTGTPAHHVTLIGWEE